VALPTLPDPAALVTLGVDTHADTHVAAALDQAAGCSAPARSPPPLPATLRCLPGRPRWGAWTGSA
jgi:hypothetical protein